VAWPGALTFVSGVKLGSDEGVHLTPSWNLARSLALTRGQKKAFF